jgi:TatA/E family protein of Tat protein translocase
MMVGKRTGGYFTMGPLGWQETVALFVLALLLFGPKKLPELGRTLGKAITEFRRASSELKATLDREMKSLEQENESLKEITRQQQLDTYNYDYSYDPGHDAYNNTAHDPYHTTHEPPSHESLPAIETTPSASAPQGAESTPGHTPEGVIARGTEPAAKTAAVPETAPTEHKV